MKREKIHEFGFDRYLQYSAIIEPGVVNKQPEIMKLKNGSYMIGFYYQGPDLESASVAEVEHLSKMFNNAIKRLDENWMIYQVICRSLSSEYPTGYFDEPTNRLIDAERYFQFTQEGKHYETFPFLFLTYLPPKHSQKGVLKALGDWIMGVTDSDEMNYIERDVKHIKEVSENFLMSFSQMMRFRPLSYTESNDELLHALNMIMNQENRPCRLPDPPDNLDCWLSRDVENGEMFVYDNKPTAILSVDGFPPSSRPGILSNIEKLPIDITWSTRFIVTDQHYARGKISMDRKKWHQKIYPFMAHIMNNPNAPADQNAIRMVNELDEALANVEQGLVIYGHYTSTVIVRAEDEDELKRKIRDVSKMFERLGFSTRVEKRNALEALLGSFPGHGRENVRKPFLHSLNYADFAPLTNSWAGSEFCPCPPPNYPPNSPALLQAASVGTTPFRFNLHVDDVGHTLIMGPTGSGKSTLLASIASQFERYNGAQIFVFDKGRSMYALTAACSDAVHYDLGHLKDSGGLCPLAELDTEEDLAWAFNYLETLLELQLESNKADVVGSGDRNLMRQAVRNLARTTRTSAQRSLTNLLSTLQSPKIRDLMTFYQTGSTAGAFLDGKSNDIEFKSMVTFEIEDLMTYGSHVRLPVLLYLFRQIEKRLTGRPSLLIIDEAWLAIGEPVFAKKIKEWLKVLRKANCAVVLATQEVGDIADSPITGALVESCPTRIFLPNPDAKTERSRELYRKTFGLNDTQIDLIANAVRKSQYYYTSPLGQRLFGLGLGGVALSFVGAGAKEDIARITALRNEHGDEWPYHWLMERGFPRYAEAWLDSYTEYAALKAEREVS